MHILRFCVPEFQFVFGNATAIPSHLINGVKFGRESSLYLGVFCLVSRIRRLESPGNSQPTSLFSFWIPSDILHRLTTSKHCLIELELIYSKNTIPGNWDEQSSYECLQIKDFVLESVLVLLSFFHLQFCIYRTLYNLQCLQMLGHKKIFYVLHFFRND